MTEEDNMTTTAPTLIDSADLATFQDAALRLREVETALSGAFIERDEEVRAMMLALVAKVHLLLLGPPGTAKSAIANALAKSLDNGRIFSVLLTKFSVPEDVFGPVSLRGLESDDYRRVTAGYLPEAEVAFVDEIFKSNSALLNSLLTVLNERAFDNGGTRTSIPLEIAIGASNELPEEGEGLEALYDRFMLRRWVGAIADDDNFESLLLMEGEPEIDAVLLPSDLETVRSFAAKVDIRPVVPMFTALRRALAQEHGIVASDRRWRSCVRIVKASAALDGRLVATGSDMLALVDSLWNAPEERAPIFGTLAGLVAPDLAAALALVDAAAEISESIAGDCGVQALATANTETKKILAEISKLDGVEAEVAKVEALQRAIARRVLAAVGGI
jgi:MoxR-like ATPase